MEGATYVWTQAEVRDVLGEREATLFEAAYGVTPDGNWEGATILSRVRDDASLAREASIAPEEVGRRLDAARRALLAARAARPQPARDDKVLAAWNGLALRAFAEPHRPCPTVGGTRPWRPASLDRSGPGCEAPMAGSGARGRTDGRALRQCSRITRISRRGSSPSIRRRSTRRGSSGRQS
ncbi:MAG: hypothetical protein R3C32_15565 [Chloroflexota bacterium]